MEGTEPRADEGTTTKPQTEGAPSGQGLAISSLVLGISAFVLVCVAPLSAVLALCAIVLGAVHLRRGVAGKGAAGRGVAIAGVSTGSVSLLLAVAVSCLYFYLPKMFGGLGSERFNTYKNKPAPSFTLTDTEGRTHTLSQYQGKVVLVNFWATW